MDGLDVQHGNPTFGDETLLGHVQVEQVERVVNRFDFADLHEPVLEVLGGSDQHAVTMVLRLSQDGVQVLDSCHDAHRHFATIGRRLRARIQSGAESFANLLHASLQLVALEEDDENGFVDVVTLERMKINLMKIIFKVSQVGKEGKILFQLDLIQGLSTKILFEFGRSRASVFAHCKNDFACAKTDLILK